MQRIDVQRRLMHVYEVMRRKKLASTVLFGVLVPAVLYSAAREVVGSEPAPRATPTLERGHHTELVAILYSSSACRANQITGFRQAIRQLPDRLRSRAAITGSAPRTIGVSVDPDLATGISYLQALARFDEISAGGGWLNYLSTDLVWRSGVLEAAIPQLLILSRSVDIGDEILSVKTERVVVVLTGANEIIRWINSGPPLSGSEVGR